MSPMPFDDENGPVYRVLPANVGVYLKGWLHDEVPDMCVAISDGSASGQARLSPLICRLSIPLSITTFAFYNINAAAVLLVNGRSEKRFNATIARSRDATPLVTQGSCYSRQIDEKR